MVSVVYHEGGHDICMSIPHSEPGPSNPYSYPIPLPSSLAAAKRRILPAAVKPDEGDRAKSAKGKRKKRNFKSKRANAKKSLSHPQTQINLANKPSTPTIAKKEVDRFTALNAEPKYTPASLEGSRTFKRQREHLPTNWPSKPSDRDSYYWYYNDERDNLQPLDPKSKLMLFVPVLDAQPLFREGAAIIGSPLGSDLSINYDDSRHATLAYADQAELVASIHLASYPLKAQMVIKRELVKLVGSFDPFLGVVTVEDVDLFEAWTGVRSNSLVTTGGAGSRRRKWQEFLLNRPDVADVPALRRKFEAEFDF